MKKRIVSNLSGGGGSLLSGCEAPAPVRVSETGRARNWTMPPLRLEREWRERTNSATIDNRCVEFDRRENQRCAFTMAEILLSLTIIGVVAAITLPSLTGNINERTWNTQRKALYARFSQAIALMPALNGYGTLTEGDSSTSAVDTAAETFVTNGLSKVLKINNICDSEHLEDCGIPDKISPLGGGSPIPIPVSLVGLNSMFDGSTIIVDNSGGSQHYVYSQQDTKAAAFETANGESIIVYYNPACVSDMGETTFSYVQPKMCANFIYDLNGTKGPNTVGKDIGFMTALFPTDSIVVAPVPVNFNGKNGSHEDAVAQCRNYEDSRLPNIHEAMSMFYNRSLLGSSWTGLAIWTGTASGVGSFWRQNLNTGHRTPSNTSEWNVRCVKR